jgi:hypothetical protein
MNCKPGDLAMYVGLNQEYIGHVVTVVSPTTADSPLAVDGPWWHVEPKIGGKYSRTSDASLRPIRDPGDDAVDETLLWLPSPKRERA